MSIVSHLLISFFFFFFFFKQKTAYEMRISDWSADVCSSDLAGDAPWWHGGGGGARKAARRAFHRLRPRACQSRATHGFARARSAAGGRGAAGGKRRPRFLSPPRLARRMVRRSERRGA